jgi:hypothetical protein
LLEDSYFSRFFTKFVEIIAISFATACSAYLVAHFVGPPPATGPAPVAVSVGAATPPPAVEMSKNPAVPAPPVAASSAIEEPRPATRPMTDASVAQPAPKAAKSAPSAAQVPAPKDVKATASVPRGEKSAEALARAALANVDADRAAPPDTPVRRIPAGPGPMASPPVVDAAPNDLPPRAAEMPPPAAVEVPPRPVATVDPLPPNSGAPELAAPRAEVPRAESPIEEERGLFALPKRMLGLLRPGTPSLADEGPRRPPLPVGEERPE